MAVKTYSIDKNTAEKFKEQTPEQETSKVLENLMKEYIEGSPEQKIVLDVSKNRLTDSQNELLEMFIDNNLSSKSTQSAFQNARGRNIYSRSHHFGKAMKAISNSKMPYSTENGKVVTEKVECDCGASFYFNIYVAQDGFCPNCEKKAVRLP